MCAVCNSESVSSSFLTDGDMWSGAEFDTSAVNVSSQVDTVDCSDLC